MPGCPCSSRPIQNDRSHRSRTGSEPHRDLPALDFLHSPKGRDPGDAVPENSNWGIRYPPSTFVQHVRRTPEGLCRPRCLSALQAACRPAAASGRHGTARSERPAG
ncbi:hypothetical protein GCM10010406_55700 [Streptomyces thermolineatus]|uniref:Uncharacterized protein n=1 Tax=Streptomyces thermolineatus TaxID=44033 RepID=A0ABN3N1A0_9ACTN